MIKVSIVIVCMNNLKDLYPCLDSIIKFTTQTSYEIFVVAYLFTDENLQDLGKNYPRVKIIVSNEIRGFSENNNLALQQAAGEYCLILNDDTNFNTPVIDLLVESIEKYEEAEVFSPKIINSNGTFVCGRAPLRLITHFAYNFLRVNYIPFYDRKYINREGVFQTYNIQGCCFLIKTETFRQMNFFDEKYFFCPEDVALSTTLNNLGYKCYVNADIILYHNHANTFSKTILATYPAMQKGELIFHSKNSKTRYNFIGLIMMLSYLLFMLVWFLQIQKEREKRIKNIQRYKNALVTILSNKTPKEIFTSFFVNNKS